jgi:integrase
MHDLITTTPTPLSTLGHTANRYAAQNVFADYHTRIAPNTLRRQSDDLTLFSCYLAHAGVVIDPHSLLTDPLAWEGVTYGLIDGYVRWMLQEGYAIGSVNVRLSTVKAYCKLVTKAGVLPAAEYALIKLVTGYRHAEGRNVDAGREQTRKGTKKAEAVSISTAACKALKNQPDTPQGRRDALLMCLLLDHGLRCGEIAALTPGSMDLDAGTLTFYREKVDLIQTHSLTRDTLLAARRYLDVCQPEEKLLMGSRKGGKLEGAMSTRAITGRVNVLGERIGLEGLSAHDGRHAWATSAVKGGTDIKSLQDAGGWSSPAMPLRYAESSKIANEGVKLG